jgi:hypothetical protein
MPRDGLSQYAPPPGTDGIPNYSVESARYNAFVHDVSADQNNARPIVAGGTGATSGPAALVALGGEQAKQVVTNFDSMVFAPGSFYAAAGATSAPVAGHAFAGIAYYNNASDFTVEARDLTDAMHLVYTRIMSGGVWGGWADWDKAYADASKVAKAGDTMTGSLTLAQPADFNPPAMIFTNVAAGAGFAKTLRMGGNALQIINAGNTAAIWNLDDAGDQTIYGTMAIGAAGATGLCYFGNSGTKYLNYDGTNFNLSGTLLVGGEVRATNGAVWSIAGGGSVGTYAFGNTGNKLLNYDGANFNLVGGKLIVNSQIISTDVFWSQVTANTGYYHFGNSGTKYLGYDGTNFNLNGGSLAVSGNIISGPGGNIVTGANGSLVAAFSANSGTVYFGSNLGSYLTYNGSQYSLVGGLFYTAPNYIQAGAYYCKAGAGGGFGGNVFNLYYTASVVQMWIDNANLGNLTITSDYRIKKDVIDLPGMWDTVKALRPIKYTQAEFTPPSQLAHIEQMKADGRPVEEGPMFPADNIERWGFIAHELQATLLPTASTGVKDSHDHVQSPNPMPLIAALTKALQEAMARIEALEAA